MPKRIQRRRTKGWKMPPNTVCVSRPSIFGNGFRLVHFISPATPNNPTAIDEWKVQTDIGQFTGSFTTKLAASKAAVDLYRMAANEHTDYAELWRRKVRFALSNVDYVACWCPLDQPCHADVLLEIANAGVQGEKKS